MRILSSKKFSFILNFLYNKFPQLQNSLFNDKTRIYWLLNDINDFLKCSRIDCQNKILKNVDSIIYGYSTVYTNGKKFHCCNKCAQLDIDTIKQIKMTKLKHFGDENFTNSAKSKETRLERYGNENYVNVEKCKHTKKERYGDENYNNKEKTVKTNLKRYGVKNVFEAKLIKNKIKNRWLSHGYDHPMHNKDIVIKTITRYKYNNICFDSSWELALYIWLVDNKIKFEYHPNINFKYSFENIEHTYWPDFIIENKIYEIKGGQYFQNNKMICPYDRSKDDIFQAKYECMLKNNVIIISVNEIKKYLDFVDTKYGKQYLKQFAIKK